MGLGNDRVLALMTQRALFDSLFETIMPFLQSHCLLASPSPIEGDILASAYLHELQSHAACPYLYT